MDYRGFPVHPQTKAVRGDQGWDPATGAVSFPVYQSATFRHPSLEETTGWDYSRQGNPTRTELEGTVAALEGGTDALAFSTGMAAVTAALELFGAGDHLVFCEDLYGGTYRYLELLARRHGIAFDFVDTRDPGTVQKAIRPETKALFVETPSNPLMRVCDLGALAALCRDRNILFFVDNTFLTPLLQRPLDLGADLVIHSGTKFLAGHNDVLSGFLVTSRPDLAEKLRVISKTIGGVLSPFDSWLVLRGLKTLGVRLERQQANALVLAKFLEKHPRVAEVFYPGLESHESFAVNSRQASGAGAMLSFRVKDPKMVHSILKNVKLILFAESLGGVESLITFPLTQTHAAIPKQTLDRLGVDETLLRLSVGIEHADDLVRDLEQALQV